MRVFFRIFYMKTIKLQKPLRSRMDRTVLKKKIQNKSKILQKRESTILEWRPWNWRILALIGEDKEVIDVYEKRPHMTCRIFTIHKKLKRKQKVLNQPREASVARWSWKSIIWVDVCVRPQRSPYKFPLFMSPCLQPVKDRAGKIKWLLLSAPECSSCPSKVTFTPTTFSIYSCCTHQTLRGSIHKALALALIHTSMCVMHIFTGFLKAYCEVLLLCASS